MRLRARMAVAAVGVALAVGADLPGLVGAVAFVLLGVVPLVVVLTNLRAGVYPHRRPWVLLAAGSLLFTVANVVWTYYVGVLGHPSATGSLTEVLYPVGYLCILVATLQVVRLRCPGDPGGLLDAAIAAIAVGVVVWVVLLMPAMSGRGVPFSVVAAMLVNLLVCAGMLGALLRVIASPSTRSRCLVWMGVATLSIVIGNAAAATAYRDGAYVGGWVDWCWDLAYVFLALAAADPSAQTVTHPTADPTERLGLPRLVVLGLCLSVSPIITVTQALRGVPVDPLLAATANVLLVPLALARVRVVAAGRERAEAELARLALHDPLTGLPNRVLLLRRLDQALDRSDTSRNGKVALLFCDLDGFKQVNDALGHDAGDELLTVVAARLHEAVRAGDTVARLGGDEFVVLSMVRDEAEATRLAGRVRQAVRGRYRLRGGTAAVGISIGTVVAEGRSTPAEKLIAAADERMYVDKRSRGNLVAVHRHRIPDQRP